MVFDKNDQLNEMLIGENALRTLSKLVILTL